MEILIGILLALGWILMFPVLHFISTFFHEMGHAIPALLFTHNDVTVYVGSYGDDSKSLSFKLGRFRIHFGFEILNWKIGQCSTGRIENTRLHILILLGGPIASLIVSGVLIYILQDSAGSVLYYITFIFLLMAIYDFVINLVPRAYSMADGMVIMSDGGQLMSIYQRSRMDPEEKELVEMLHNKEHSNAIEKLEALTQSIGRKPYYYHWLVDIYQETNDHAKIISTYENMVDHFPLNPNDYKVIGEAYMELKNNSEAIRCFDQYLHFQYKDAKILSARGMAKLNIGEYEDGYRDLKGSLVIGLEASDALEVLTQAGLAALMMEDRELSKELLDKASSMDAEGSNVNLQLHWAFYYEKTNDPMKALTYFEKAKSLGSTYHGLEYKIYLMEEWIKKNNW